MLAVGASIFLARLPLAVASPVVEPAGAADCEAVLARLSKVGESRGYNIDSSGSELYGSRGWTNLQASCSEGLVQIAFLEVTGEAVSVNFDYHDESLALELVGEYPGVGNLSRTALIDGVRTDPMGGFISFEGDTQTASAYIEYSLDGHVRNDAGDATPVNTTFESTLNTSSIWKDANIVAFGVTGVWDPGMAQYERAFETMLSVAVPSPVSAVDKDLVAAVSGCSVTTTLCGAAVFLPPISSLCSGSLGGCLTLAACFLSDCQGDG